MDKSKLNYWIDVGLAISFIVCFITGIMKWPDLLPKFGISYSSLPMLKITRLHDISGLIMGILVFIHLILHWKWIVVMTKNIFKRKEKEVQKKSTE